MTAVDPNPSPGSTAGDGPSPSPSPSPGPSHAAEPDPATDRFASPVPVANPAMVGLPSFMVGAIALALVLTGFVPQTLVGAPIAIIALATGLGQTTAMVFALRAGESAVAGVFGIFAGFWLSYAAFVLGVVHNWYGFNVAPTGTSIDQVNTAVAASGANILDAQKVFLLSWLILIVILTLGTVRLPLAFSVLFVLVDLALLFVYLGTVNASAGQLKTGGYFAFGFVAVGVYLFLDATMAATGGKNLPLGRAILT